MNSERRTIEPRALAAVSLRQWTVFKLFWRTHTFAAVVEPTIMLLAFGFGFGKLVAHVDGIPYIQFVGTGVVATSVLFSSVFGGMFDSLYKRRYVHIYDAMLAAPVDVEEVVTGEVLFIATRAGIFGAVPLLVAFCFGLPPQPRDAAGAGGRRADRHRLRSARHALLDDGRDLRRPQLRRQRRGHAALPGRRHVLPDQPDSFRS